MAVLILIYQFKSDDRILLVLGNASLALPTPVLTGSGLEFDSQGNSQLHGLTIKHPRRSKPQGTGTSLILQPYKIDGYANLLKNNTFICEQKIIKIMYQVTRVFADKAL